MGIRNSVGKILIPVRGGIVFCAEYQAVYDSFTTKPSAAVAVIDNAMVKGWVDSGEWAIEDIIYVFGGHTNDDGEALINWKNPGTYDAEIVLNGGTMNFIAFEGFQSDDGAYIRTHYNPSSNGVNFVQNSTNIGTYLRTNVSEKRFEFGVKQVASNNSTILASRWTDDTAYAKVNNDAYTTVGNLDSRGMFYLNRRDAVKQQIYKNKIETETSEASVGVPSAELYFLCYSVDGVPTSPSTKQCSLGSAGGGKTQVNVNNFTDTFETRMDALGKGVIT